MNGHCKSCKKKKQVGERKATARIVTTDRQGREGLDSQAVGTLYACFTGPMKSAKESFKGNCPVTVGLSQYPRELSIHKRISLSVPHLLFT